MKTKVQFFLFLLICVLTVSRSFAQCSTGVSPSYSSSCSAEYYTSITASGTGVTSTINVSGSSCAGTYVDYSASQGVTTTAGTTVNLNISRYTTSYTGYITVYVDWNNNGIYEATELAGSMITLPSSTLSTVYSFVVPSTGVVSGVNLQMRVMLSEQSSGAPCSANYGETCDFYINVGCPATPVILVSPTSPSICTGGSGTLLTASGAGATGVYSWSPSTGLSATTGASVTANPGSTVTYTVTGAVSSGCTSGTDVVTVNVNTAPGTITGTDSVCAGSVTTLSDAVTGGTWSSSNPTAATVDAAGNVFGASAGVTNISYTTGGSCIVSMSVSVKAAPSSILGPSAICSGFNVTLSDAVTGGVWSSDNVSVASVTGGGIVYGITAGNAGISYTIGSCSATLAMSVNTIQPITGGTSVCAGSTIALSDVTPGGVWSSGGVTAATVSGTGVVTGVASGSATIYYTIGACVSSQLVTVAFPVPAISGPGTVCEGSSITLSDGAAGGVWSSDNVSVATVSGGSVLGISGGTADISYVVGGCSSFVTITVNANNAGIITGKDSVCMGTGHSVTLSDNVSGGVWSSTTTSRATVNSSIGVVTGGTLSGVDTIKYTISNSCGTYVAKFVMHVRTAAQCATGINEPATAAITELKIFPNPNTGSFIMNLNSDIDEDVHIIVTNILGEKIKEFTTATNKDVDVRLDHVAGIYLLSASTAHGRYVGKVIIN